jgi:hypothetical protein
LPERLIVNNKLTAAAVASIALGSTFFFPGASFAGTSCPSGSTLVSGTTCEVVFNETPNAAWTPPAGITKLEALVVGAGGGGDAWYGGGAGAVQLVDLATTGNVTVTVGVTAIANYDSSEDSSVSQASNTTTSPGGEPAPAGWNGGGDSGNQNSGATWGRGSAGAGGDADYSDGGPGLVVSDIAAPGSLFANDDDCYGGGATGYYIWETSTPGTFGFDFYGSGCGAASFEIPSGATEISAGNYSFTAADYTAAKASLVPVAARANSGSGGTALWANFDNSQAAVAAGADGKVVLRFTVPAEKLANTGVDSTKNLVETGFGAALLVAGATVLTAIRRRKNNK